MLPQTLRRRSSRQANGAVKVLLPGRAMGPASALIPLTDSLRRERSRLALVGLVIAAACIDIALAVPVRGPHIFGDELIYWDLSRTFASTAHLTARGGAHLGYGPVYPTLISFAHSLAGSERGAYLLARCVNAFLFSLAAVPAYAIASRVLKPRLALASAALAALLPSVVYASAIMTESAFYPVFIAAVWLMLRALDRPSPLRQLALLATIAVAFFVRAQAVVLLPAYVAAVIVLRLLERREGDRPPQESLVRQHRTTILVLAGGGFMWLLLGVARGHSPLSVFGSYHVLATGYPLLSTIRWALANLADLELYVGVIPFAAFALTLISACRSAKLSAELRRLVIVSASVCLGMLAATTALSASRWGLGRVHERNFFYVAPLLVIVFLTWIDRGMPRSRRAIVAVAPLVALLPLTIPPTAVSRSGLDALVLFWWQILPGGLAVLAMTGVTIAGLILFAAIRTPGILVRFCLVLMFVTLLAGEQMEIESGYIHQPSQPNFGWIDDAVGGNSNVVAIWPSSARPTLSPTTDRFWLTEFYNRSVRNVASVGGPFPDGLPAVHLSRDADGCLVGAIRPRPTFAVVDARFPIAAAVVLRDQKARMILYRLPPASAQRCRVRLVR